MKVAPNATLAIASLCSRAVVNGVAEPVSAGEYCVDSTMKP